MAKNNVQYNEISRAAITDTRDIIISDCSRGGFTIAQQVVAMEGDRAIPVFMKGAFRIDDLQGLYNLRDSLNWAIQTVEDRENADYEEDESWD